MGAAQNRGIARLGYEAFNRGGVEAILEYLDAEIEWRMWERFSRAPRVYRGHDDVREVLALFRENFDDFRVEPLDFIEDGDRVVVPVRFSGRVKGTGEPAEFELVQAWIAHEGKAVRLDVYPDVETAMATQARQAEAAG